MRLLGIFMFLVLFCSFFSCNSLNKNEQITPSIEDYLVELSLCYWDLHYRFPTSYMQARDTEAWFFEQCKPIDSLLLRNISKIVFWNRDTVLLITYENNTLAAVHLPCSCDWTDELPLGPRAYDSNEHLILDDFIKIDENGYQYHLTYDLINYVHPTIEQRMEKMGYTVVRNDERTYPQYLLIEYRSETDSIQLIRACEKYSYYFHEEYATILRSVFSEYCNINHVSRLLTPVNVYLIASNDSMRYEGLNE